MSRNFLISRLSSLGDIVCSLPAASAIKKGIADSRITWVVEERFADAVKCCSAVDEVLTVSPALRLTLSQAPSFEAALDLQGLLKSALVLSRIKAEKKVGYHWQREGSALFSQRVLPDPTSVHVVDQYVDVARAVGGEADRAEFGLVPEDASIQRVIGLLGGLGTAGGAASATSRTLPNEFVVINPGSARANKRWPVESFAKLIDRIPLPAVIIGSAGEAMGEQISTLAKSNPLNLTGRTTISELIALISLGKAHIGGDTGSTHVAAALGVPAIGLYSTTRPERSCPYGQIERCHYDREGLDRIEPGIVLNTIVEAIG